MMTLDVANPDRYRLKLMGNEKEFDSQLSPLAVNFIENFILDIQEKAKRPAKILEFGSGVSTILFSKLFPLSEIYSVEGDVNWFEMVTKWIDQENCKNITRIFEPQTNFYISDNTNNLDYFEKTREFDLPFDLIINDGGMREIVGDFILKNANEYLSIGGLYLRHDYEKYLSGEWRGFHIDKEIRYEQFVLDNPTYSLITVNGNGRWGYHCEFGGVWRRL
jgi:hypothetical protein